MMDSKNRNTNETTIRNSGQTPAHRVRCAARLESLDTSDPQFETIPEDEFAVEGFVVNPGSTHTLHISMTRELDERDRNDVSVGSQGLYL